MGGTELHLDGGAIPIGITAQVAAQLEAHPGVTTLVLNSPGGQIPAARTLSGLVLTDGLDTYVEGSCSSACTLIFAAGTRRTLGPPDARLGGFHSYALLIPPSGHPNIDPAEEMQRDLAYLKAAALCLIFWPASPPRSRRMTCGFRPIRS